MIIRMISVGRRLTMKGESFRFCRRRSLRDPYDLDFPRGGMTRGSGRS